MKVVTAFDSFKGCMSAKEACTSVAFALSQSAPDLEVVSLPVSDGGEGMVECLVESLGLEEVTVNVHGPLMEPITARYALSLDGTTAYMEMAEASGLTLVPVERRNPMLTTTYGVGEMIVDAVKRGCKHIVMGIGGSATCDGGRGMVNALQSHLPLAVDVTVASDVTNPLCGKNGAAYVFAPQKGATPEQVVMLDARLQEFANETVSKGIASPELANHPGAGAAGGLGYALMAYLNANLQSGIDLCLDIIGFDEKIANADCIITGEGKSDAQTLMGKVPMGILRRAQRHGIPVFLLSGAVEDKEMLVEHGFAHVASINDGDKRPLQELLNKNVATRNLQRASLVVLN